MVEDVADGGREAGEQGVPLDVDLVPQRRVLHHQIATMTGQHAEFGMGLIERRLDQTEAIDGGAMDGLEVGLIGLVLGIGGDAELLGGQGMDDPRLEAGGDEGGAGSAGDNGRSVRWRR